MQALEAWNAARAVRALAALAPARSLLRTRRSHMTPPPMLGHYRIENELGSGGTGAVYRAVDTRLNRHVAIKFWRYHGSSLDAGRRMLKEARAASALNHPNIVIVHDFGETNDGDTFIVQEYIEGRTLARDTERAHPPRRGARDRRRRLRAPSRRRTPLASCTGTSSPRT